MSEDKTTVEEPQANPYNKTKPWTDTTEKPRGLLGANDSMAYKDPEPVEPTEAATPEEVLEKEPTTYRKVDYKKRHDDLKRHYDNKLNEWKAEKGRLETVIATSAPAVVPKTPEEMATFKEQYPDVYDVVDTVATEKAQEQLAKVNAEIEELRGRAIEASSREAMLILEKAHPDYHEIANSDEFHEWAQTQPQVIQDWVYDNTSDASLAARALDLFKRDTGSSDSQKKPAKKAKPRKKADAAEAVLIKETIDPSAKEAKVWHTSEIANLSLADFEKLEPELQKAGAEGRIVKG